MGIVSTTYSYEDNHARVDLRDDGSFWLQLGAAGILIKDIEELGNVTALLNYVNKEELSGG